MANETSRFLIGIDLGTTNSALAYVDSRAKFRRGVPVVHHFQIPQLVAEGEVSALPTLPSFLYFLDESETDRGRLTLPWHEDATAVVGIFAREHGGLLPGRLVSSAKSWLCHSRVDRRANILPWDPDHPDSTCSPVDAATGYLLHLCDAWNAVMADNGRDESALFEQQDIVLTIPASFDEEARELTIEAAKAAGIERLTLLEEPLAAFYSWMAAHHHRLAKTLHDGQLVLVCDIGGGTTDFSLIRVELENDDIRFIRTAIGEHLLLGGDNLDLALAAVVEAKLGHPRLTLRQRKALQRQCCQAKEGLLAGTASRSVPIRVLGSGSSVIGGAMIAELTQEDVKNVVLQGFLPLTPLTELPKAERRIGLRELGLPYATEPAITKHLAAFLTRNRDENGQFRFPDAVLFNGGFFTPKLVRKTLLQALETWGREFNSEYRVAELSTQSLDIAVALGAAFYGHTRRTGGLRITGGSGRAFYLGVAPSESLPAGQVQAVCVLPRGTEGGTTLDLTDRDFTVLANRPVAFTLYSSPFRSDSHGALVTLPEEELHRHAPLATMLRYGKRSKEAELAVRLTAGYTDLGTLELWCASRWTEHRWRLQFELRSAELAADDETEEAETSETVISETSLETAKKLIQAVFTTPSTTTDDSLTPEGLVGRLENLFGYGKDSWPIATIRVLCDVLLENAEGRKKRANYELRWLNLFGFCLRPGFGSTLDEWRIKEAWKIYLRGVTFSNDIQSQVEMLVLLGRIAGGLSTGQQTEINHRMVALLGLNPRQKPKRVHPQIERDGWRLLASLEHLSAAIKESHGEVLARKLLEKPGNQSFLWALGRLGARIPLYGHLNRVVPVQTVESWIKRLLAAPEFTWDTASTLAQLGALTEDPVRDISDDLRARILRRLEDVPNSEALARTLREVVPLVPAQGTRIFGESLPEGLRLS
ncbi:MAG: hsp70 family protein [Blastocatellia bacterium]|nr:hsp70 family protein [Blastocatellia bacterium]